RTCDTVVVMRKGKIAAEGEVAALRKTQGVQVDVELHIPSEAFVAAMVTRGGAIQKQLGSNYRISLNHGTPDISRVLFEAARESGAQVRGFRPASRSLEDIFL